MQVKKLTFEDIMEREVIFFDGKKKKACSLLCKRLQIDYLPDFEGEYKFYYNSKRDAFEKQKISEDQYVSANRFITDGSNIALFEKNEHQVLFVREGEVLVGVVHVCDYNRDIVLQAIQKDVLAFEQLLRKYLTLDGKTNEDVWNVLNKNHDSKAGNLSPFQTFYLTDLITYAMKGSVRNWKPSQETYDHIRWLRNSAMHGKDMISSDDSFYYNTSDLRNLFAALDTLTKAYQELLKLVRKKTAKISKEMNRKKLELLEKDFKLTLGQFLTYQ